MGRSARGVVGVGILVAGIGAATLLPSGPFAAPPAAATGLRAYDGCGPLLESFRAELRRTATPFGWGWAGGDVMFEQTAVASAAAGAAPASGRLVGESQSFDAPTSSDTGTNVQERGVDEPDIAKLSDGLLVTLARGALQVVRAGADPTSLAALDLPRVASSVDGFDGFDGAGGGGELLVDGDRVLVVLQGMRPLPAAPSPAAPEGKGPSAVPQEPDGEGPSLVPSPPDREGPSLVPAPPDGAEPSVVPLPVPEPTVAVPAPSDLPAPAAPSADVASYSRSWGGPSLTPSTTLLLADLSDPDEPRWIEEWTVDGSYVSARLADGVVRLVTRSTPSLAPAIVAEPYRPEDEKAALAANQAAAAGITAAQILPTAVHRVGGRTVSTGSVMGCEDVAAPVEAVGAGLLTVTSLRPADGLTPLDTRAVQADGDLVYATADRLIIATSRWGTTAGTVPAPTGDVTTQLHSFDTTADAVRYLGTGSVPGYVYGRWALSWHEDALRVATTEGEPWGAAATSSTLTILRERDGALVPAGRVTGLGKGERIQAVRFLGDLATVVTFRQTDPLYVLDLSDPDLPRLLGELKVPGFSTYLHPVGDDRLLGIGMEADEKTGRTTGLQSSLFDLSDLSTPKQLSRIPLGGESTYSEALQESRAFGYDPARRLAVLPMSDWSTGRSSVPGITVGRDGTLREIGRLPVPGGAGARRVLHDEDHVYAVTDQGVIVGSSVDMAPTGSVAY